MCGSPAQHIHQSAGMARGILVNEPDDKPDEQLFMIATRVLVNLGQPCQGLAELFY